MLKYKLNSGNDMPALGLGTWKSAPGAVYQAVVEAVDIGYRHIDCAAIYGNEPEIGSAFSDIFAQGKISREELFITSKLWNSRHVSDDVIPALKNTLLNLKLDYLDLYLIHWPVAFKSGVVFPDSEDGFMALADAPIIATWQAMQEAVKLGLVKQIGVSNFSINKIQQLIKNADIVPAVNQVELHPYLSQNQLVDYCKANDICVTGYSPLGSMDRPESLKQADEPILLKDATVLAIANKHNATPAQILIKWALQRGIVSIPKSVSKARIAENFAATKVNLSEDDMHELNKLNINRRYVDGSGFTAVSKGYTVATLWDE